MNVFQGNELVTSTVVASEVNFIGHQMTDIFKRELLEVIAILPPKAESAGKARYFNRTQFAMVCLLSDLMVAEFKVPLAAKIAHRVMQANQRQPEVEQWAVIHTANGNVSTLPYTEAGLATGYISGSRLTFGIVIDIKNYADRVSVAIANAPRVIGGEDA